METNERSNYTVQKSDLLLGPHEIAQKLDIIEALSDEDAYYLVSSYYKDFLSNIIDSKEFNDIKKSNKFLNTLTQVCISNPLTYEQRVYCNSMIYKQISIEDEYKQNIFINLASVVNTNMTNRLMNCGLNKTIAAYLACARKSSFNQKDNISRLNFCINCIEPSLMTVQRITDIYCAVFETVDDVEDLFNYSIKDSYIYTAEDSWITESILKTAHNMDMAVLSILDSLKKEDITRILNNYYKSIQMSRLDREDVRFSLKDINKDVFKNISSVLKSFSKKDIYFP